MRRVLELPRGFDLYQQVIGAAASKRRFVEEFVRPSANARVLDLGCGTGALFASMPVGVDYVGVDVDGSYVAAARSHYGDRATFVHADATTYRPEGAFDVAIAYGVLHHLDDAKARDLLRVACVAARFVAAEPCLTAETGSFESFVMRHDRGRHIRTEAGYVRLARERFPNVRSDVVQGTYRIPFTLAIIHAS